MKTKFLKALAMVFTIATAITATAVQTHAAETKSAVRHYTVNENGITKKENSYVDANGDPIKDAFVADGAYTYFIQHDGTPMKNQLTYHPDGEHVIYFDEDGHEVFSDFASVKKSISGEAVDDLCFFDVYGYMYVDVLTYDKAGVNLCYANPYGVMERNGWFTFSNKYENGKGYANADGTLMKDTYTYDENGNYVYIQANGIVAGSVQDKPTKIRAFYQSHPFPLTPTPASETSVDYDPAINAINTIRYIAGLDANVTINETFNQYAATGAYINNRNNVLSHYPDRPSGVDDTTYEMGALGCKKSNIGYGYVSITDSILRGYMYDSDASNVDRVGHRRWILCEDLKEVGMGISGSYSNLLVIPVSGHCNVCNKKDICWPAEYTPNQLFTADTAWSVCLGSNYQRPVNEEVQVQVVRQRDGYTWNLNASNHTYSATGNYYTVGAPNYGSMSTIIFRPDFTAAGWNASDSFTVTISGIKDASGAACIFTYQVNFFEL